MCGAMYDEMPRNGNVYEDRLEKVAFYQVIQEGFPNEYIYAAG